MHNVTILATVAWLGGSLYTAAFFLHRPWLSIVVLVFGTAACGLISWQLFPTR